MLDIRRNTAYLEKNPKRKNYAWANEVVSLLRRGWVPLVSHDRSKKGMELLMSTQDLSEVKQGFKAGSDFVKNTSFVAIGVFERIRNILIAEYQKGSYKPQVYAIDPSSQKQKKADMTRLKNRHVVEGTLSQLGKGIGNPPFKVPAKSFNGNVEEFDQLGLDSRSPEDIDFFEKVYYRLWHVISAQEIAHALMKYNEVENDISYQINDLLAKKAMARRIYVSPQTGEIKDRYLNPSHVKWIKGQRKDGKDAICKGYETMVTVQQFLEVVGPGFDYLRDIKVLLDAVNFANGTGFTGTAMENGQVMILGPEGTVAVTLGSFLSHKVLLGYMEWKSVDGDAMKRHKKTGIVLPCDYDKEMPATSPYQKEVTEYQRTYKTFFVGTSLYSQYLFQFSPLYHQLTWGANDEYSGYSIITWVEEGKSAVELAEPFIKIANSAFYKMLWGIEQSTPRKRVYNYEAIAQIVSKIKPRSSAPVGQTPNRPGLQQPVPQAGAEGMINEVLGMFTNSLYELYTIPKIDGQALGGNQRPHYWDEGGLDPIAVAMQTVLDWADAQVSARLGINALREAYSPDPKDGFKLNMEAMKQSRNATHYIPSGMSFMLRAAAESELALAQDAINYGNNATVAFLEDLVGPDCLASFTTLEGKAMHRYGIFVDVINAAERKEELKMEALQAYQKGEIGYEHYLLIKEIQDYTKAGMVLAFFKQRAEKIKQKQEALAHQRAMELQNAKVQGELAVVDKKGQWEFDKEDLRGEWYMRAHQIPADAAIHKKQMEQDNNAQKMQEKADADIKKLRAEEDVKNQSALPATSGPAPAPSPGA